MFVSAFSLAPLLYRYVFIAMGVRAEIRDTGCTIFFVPLPHVLVDDWVLAIVQPSRDSNKGNVVSYVNTCVLEVVTLYRDGDKQMVLSAATDKIRFNEGL